MIDSQPYHHTLRVAPQKTSKDRNRTGKNFRKEQIHRHAYTDRQTDRQTQAQTDTHAHTYTTFHKCCPAGDDNTAIRRGHSSLNVSRKRALIAWAASNCVAPSTRVASWAKLYWVPGPSEVRCGMEGPNKGDALPRGRRSGAVMEVAGPPVRTGWNSCCIQGSIPRS